MNERSTGDRKIAYALLRIVLGLNIATHGLARLIVGPSTFAQTLVQQFASTPLPFWSVHLFALSLPWIEAMTGLGILVGVFTRCALVIGILEIAALTFGTTLRQDWESAGLQLSYALVYALLLATREYNVYSIDGLLQKSGTTRWPRIAEEIHAPDPTNFCRRCGGGGLARTDGSPTFS